MKTCVICQTYFVYVGKHKRQTCSDACAIRLRVENMPVSCKQRGPAFDAKVAELWGTGLSTKLMGDQLGVTKNTIVSIVHRLGLPSRGSPIGRKGPAKPTHILLPPQGQSRLSPSQIASMGRRAPKPAPRPYEPPRLPVCDVRTCQWPFGEPRTKGFRFCGEKTVLGMPYCAAHCRIAYPHWRKEAA